MKYVLIDAWSHVMMDADSRTTAIRSQWERLLSNKRIGFENGSIVAIDRIRDDDPLTEFLYDSNRIIYTSAFRRMQHKTQVYSLPNTDYVRNRLTHTIEVAQIGYFLGAMVGHWLKEKNYLPEGRTSADVADVVYNACLIHDIGNPPFGHVGEEAIRNWFKANRNNGLMAQISENEQQDFLKFDGNAQGFRVITRTQGWRQEGGMRLSAAVLAAFIKYPYTAACLKKEKNSTRKRINLVFFRKTLILLQSYSIPLV